MKGGSRISASSRQRWRRTTTRGLRRHGLAVSDVVATILLLALTVTLFASIFFFVNTFPRPPPQPANQFQASLTYGGVTGKAIQFVNILHLSGPTITGATTSQTAVYLYSADKPFVFAAPFTLGYGLGGSSVWQLGQTWQGNVTSYGLASPDNITISIISNSQLVFRIVLPGSVPNPPPTFVQAGIFPARPFVGQTFMVFTQIVSSNLNASTVFLNFSQIPGVSGPTVVLMNFNANTGLFFFNISGGSKAAGTFYVFVNASDLARHQNSVAIPVVVSTGGSTGGSSFPVTLSANTSRPVNGSALQLVASVTDSLNSSQTISVQFLVNGFVIGSAAAQTLPAGGSAVYTLTWTPNFVGSANFLAAASSTSAFSTGTLSVTIFPRILLVAHNVVAGTSTKFNDSGLLAQELTAAGFPFRTSFLSCNSALPSFSGVDVVVIDFGSATGLGCTAVPPSTTDQGKVTNSQNFWVIGANAFSATTCASYTAAYLTLFGITTSGGTCTTAVTAATTALTYTATGASAFLGAGVPGSLTLNKTVAGSSAFEPYFYFTNGVTHPWLKDPGGKALGAWMVNGGARQVALGTDPALMTSTLPNGNAWGSGAAGTSVVYNVMNFLCKLAGTTQPNRLTADFEVGGNVLVGQKHGQFTDVYSALRANGASSGFLTATLFVNGTPALYQGQIVSQTITVNPNGSWAYVTLVWVAPVAGPYTLSVVLSTVPADVGAVTSQFPVALLNQPIVFT